MTGYFLRCSKGDRQGESSAAEDIIAKDIPVFYGKVVYASSVQSNDSVLQSSLTNFPPQKVELYFGENKFRMIEYGGLSHANIIIYSDKQEAWQLDTATKIAHLGEYSDMSDPNGALKETMPDHFAPTVQKLGETENISGFICHKYKIIRSGFIPENDEVHIWVTHEFKFPSSRFDVQTEVNRSTVPLPLYIGYPDGAILKLHVHNEHYDRTYAVTEIKKELLPDSIFFIPANYQKK